MPTVEVTADEVLAFWFGPPGGDPLARSATWWKKDPAFDAEIGRRFGATLEQASRGELDTWATSARGRLALIVVLDQFSRNVHRGTPRAFAQDGRALTLAQGGLEQGDDDNLDPILAQFLIMPLMHAENANVQRECVTRLERLRDRAPEALRGYFDNSVSFAHAHAVIIERFGRFPHRNALLGRTSTDEESKFLTEPNSSF